jgi:hypothetical protein
VRQEFVYEALWLDAGRRLPFSMPIFSKLAIAMNENYNGALKGNFEKKDTCHQQFRAQYVYVTE